MQKKRFAAVGFVLLIALTGAAALIISRAALPATVSVQPESGTLSGAAEKRTDQTAAGGSYVQFNDPSPPGPRPVNPNATEGTVKLYQYLKSLPSRSSSKYLSGQHVGNNATIQGEMPRIAAIKNASGKDVAVWGFDPNGATISNTAFNLLKEHWDQGGLITISDHAPNPVTGEPLFKDGSGNNANMDYNVDRMLTPGTNEWNKWHEQLDKQAANLKRFADAGVTIMWRPYHEMNCAWWWWTFKASNQTLTPAKYIQIYREMYNYFTHTKGINNVLWIWAPHICDNAGLGLNAWYPGDEYVDIVGIDDYSGGAHATFQLNTIKNFIAAHPTKAFAFTELGNPAGAGGWDLMVGPDSLMGLLQNNARETTYYLFWNSRKWRHPDQVNYVQFLQHNLVATREDSAARDR